jgi:hypothetical protein
VQFCAFCCARSRLPFARFQLGLGVQSLTQGNQSLLLSFLLLLAFNPPPLLSLSAL